MKKIFLMAYARNNLGDDMFIKMILERYPNCDFYMKLKKYQYLETFDKKYSNLHVLIGNETDDELCSNDVNNYDGYVYVGGSIFIEGGEIYKISEKLYDFIKKCKENGKPFFYISSNYGPYQTKEYFELSKKVFSACTDICFRDRYSYDLFKEYSTVRYAPDYVYTYPIKRQNKIENSIGITVIDLNIRKKIKEKNNEYIEFLKNNVRRYLQNGMKVYLYTFCKREGDENTLEIILNEFKNEDNLFPVKYDGDIDEFLNQYGKMEYMICSKFHGMILSSLYNQKMYVVSYSKKIDNVANDLDFKIPIISLEDIKSDDILNIKDFANVDEEKIDKIKEQAKKQETKFNMYYNDILVI